MTAHNGRGLDGAAPQGVIRQQLTADARQDWGWVYEVAGALGWSIPQVRQATLPEVKSALKGALWIRGVKVKDKSGDKYTDRQTLEQLMDAYPDKKPDTCASPLDERQE